MTAPILTGFGHIVIEPKDQELMAAVALALLERPIYHGFYGTLWERVAESKKTKGQS